MLYCLNWFIFKHETKRLEDLFSGTLGLGKCPMAGPVYDRRRYIVTENIAAGVKFNEKEKNERFHVSTSIDERFINISLK